MTAKVKLDYQGIEATIDKYRWTSDNKQMARVLNNLLLPQGPPTDDPNPDLTAANEMVRLFGGKVVSFEKSKFDPKVVY